MDQWRKDHNSTMDSYITEPRTVPTGVILACLGQDQSTSSGKEGDGGVSLSIHHPLIGLADYGKLVF